MHHGKATRRAVLSLAAAAVLTMASSASAGFNGGVERFDGTTPDIATWEESAGSGGVISQDGQLNMTGSADYTTRAFPVGPGQVVSARVSVDPLPAGLGEVNAFVGLTNDSGGSSSTALSDSAFIYGRLHFQFSSNGTTTGNFDAGSTWQIIAAGTTPVSTGQTYVLEVSRPQPNETLARLLAADGTTVLGTQRFTLGSSPTLPGAPDHFAVALVSQQYQLGRLHAVHFDDVTITPEPSAAALFAAVAAGAGLLRRRRLPTQR